MIKNREDLKKRYLTGMYPTQEDFANVFDSFFHVNDKIEAGNIGNLGDILNQNNTYLLNEVNKLINSFKAVEYKQQDLGNIEIYSNKNYMSINTINQNTDLNFKTLTGLTGLAQLLIHNTATENIEVNIMEPESLILLEDSGIISLEPGEFLKIVLTGFGDYQTLSYRTKKTQKAELLPDDYQRGPESRILMWLATSEPNWGMDAWDFVNNKNVGEYNGTQKIYKTIQIGEHEWTSENLRIPYRDKWGTSMNWMNFTQDIINEMNQGYYGSDNVDLETFYAVNGSYVNTYDQSISYRNNFKVYNPDDTSEEKTGWDLPTSKDFFQLFGLAPRISDNPIINVLNFIGANAEDVPADYTGQWFNYKNTSGLTLTPLGRRHSGAAGDNGQKWFNYKVECGLKLKDYPVGCILFHLNNTIIISSYLYHFTQARYCRALSDKELGYKLYIDAENDRILMSDISESSVLPELSRGIERGVALRYMNRANRLVLKSWVEIQAEAAQIYNSVQK